MSKVIIITGGSRGIGRAAARLSGARGWSVAVNYLGNAAAAKETVAEVERAGGLIEAGMTGATAENMMTAANAMGDGMRGLAAAIQARAPVVYASFADWVGALPAAVRGVPAMWRAVLAVPPIAPPDAGDDTETILRQMGGDIAYQLR